MSPLICDCFSVFLFFFSLMTLTVLRSTGKRSCRMSFNPSLSDVFLMTRLGFWGLGRQSQRRSVLWVTSYWGYLITTWHYEAINLQCLIIVLLPGITRTKLLFSFPCSILWKRVTKPRSFLGCVFAKGRDKLHILEGWVSVYVIWNSSVRKIGLFSPILIQCLIYTNVHACILILRFELLGWPNCLYLFFCKIKDTFFIFNNNFINLGILSMSAISCMV